MAVYAYCRVSTREQGDSGLGLEAQLAAVGRWAAGREFVAVIEVESTRRARRELEALLGRLERGDTLVASMLDRMCRSTLEFAVMLERAADEGWSLVAVDLGVDTSTPAGRMVATVVMALAEYERELIGERTRAALAAKLAADPDSMRLPHRATSDLAVRRLLELKRAGWGNERVARQVELECFATAQGGRWCHQTVAHLWKKHGPDWA